MKKQEEGKLPVNINFVVKKFDPHKLTGIPPNFVQCGLRYAYIDDSCFNLHSIVERRSKQQIAASIQRPRPHYISRVPVRQQMIIPKHGYVRHMVPAQPEYDYPYHGGGPQQRPPFVRSPYFAYNRMSTPYTPQFRPQSENINWMGTNPSLCSPNPRYYPPTPVPPYDTSYPIRPPEQLVNFPRRRVLEEIPKDRRVEFAPQYFPSKLVDPTRVVYSALCSDKLNSPVFAVPSVGIEPNSSSFHESSHPRPVNTPNMTPPGVVPLKNDSSESYSSEIKPS